jgi:ankyrin repeat protein
MPETEASPSEDVQPSALATMFHTAASKGHIQLLEMLLKQHPSLLDDPDSKGFSPLQRALEHSQFKCAEFLSSR